MGACREGRLGWRGSQAAVSSGRRVEQVYSHRCRAARTVRDVGFTWGPPAARPLPEDLSATPLVPMCVPPCLRACVHACVSGACLPWCLAALKRCRAPGLAGAGEPCPESGPCPVEASAAPEGLLYRLPYDWVAGGGHVPGRSCMSCSAKGPEAAAAAGGAGPSCRSRSPGWAGERLRGKLGRTCGLGCTGPQGYLAGGGR